MLLSLKSVSLFTIAMVLDTLGNILFKRGMNDFSSGSSQGWSAHWQTFKFALASKVVKFGVLAMVLEAIVWLAFLSITPLNIAAPLSSANNIFILLASALFLKERVSKKRWLGVILIVIGMLLIGGSSL